MLAAQSSHSPAAGGRAPAPAGDAPLAPYLTLPVLVVEDEAMIAWLLEGLLEEMGFTDVALAANARQAEAAAARVMPRLLLSDVNLGPGPDGIATARAIRQAGPVPVVFITAYADEGTRARVERDVPGAPILRKPFSAEALRRAMETVLAADGG